MWRMRLESRREMAARGAAPLRSSQRSDNAATAEGIMSEALVKAAYGG